MTLPTYGRELLRGLPPALFEAPVVCTQPEPWALVAGHFPGGATRRLLVETMEHDAVRAHTAALGRGSAVFGVGGGQALDQAKYVAWQTGRPLVLVPTILSVDAAYTAAIGVREGQRVRYVGQVQPAHLLVDFGLLQQAPALLNRAGAGDILSIFTALWDWREAHERLGEAYDAGVAAAAQRVLDDLLAAAPELRAASEAGLRALSEAYVGEVALCDRVGSARPEEGSEHYLAYGLEALTGRHFLHGQLVGLCVLLAGRCQGQDVRPIARFLREVGLDCRYEAVGTTRAELRAALLHMGAYVREELQLLPGVFHFRSGVTPEEADRALEEVAALLA
jgi:glycerol-1-phosphate dehydrogenase [NAD(P)+]